MTEKPKYREAVEHFAAKKGVPVEQLLEELRDARGTYPGPDCLEPHEVEILASGTVLLEGSEDRMGHLMNCESCRAVVGSVRRQP